MLLVSAICQIVCEMMTSRVGVMLMSVISGQTRSHSALISKEVTGSVFDALFSISIHAFSFSIMKLLKPSGRFDLTLTTKRDGRHPFHLHYLWLITTIWHWFFPVIVRIASSSLTSQSALVLSCIDSESVREMCRVFGGGKLIYCGKKGPCQYVATEQRLKSHVIAIH